MLALVSRLALQFVKHAYSRNQARQKTRRFGTIQAKQADKVPGSPTQQWWVKNSGEQEERYFRFGFPVYGHFFELFFSPQESEGKVIL